MIGQYRLAFLLPSARRPRADHAYPRERSIVPDRRADSAHRTGAKGASEREVRDSLLAEVATLYYVDRFTQDQIARQIGRSVATVSRLLAEAEAKEIVEIRVHYPIPVVAEFQEALVKRFGLRLARVARVPDDEPHQLLTRIGDLAARYLATLLTDGAVIAVGWGTSVYEVARLVKAGPHREIRVVQALGSLGSRLSSIDNPLIARMLAERVDGTAHYLPAPMIVESQSVRDALARDPQFRETLSLFARPDIALVGIGLADPEHTGLCRAGYLDTWVLERIRANGAIGDVMVEFFDLYGRILDTDIGARVMGMRLAELRNARVVIAVAGGIVKAPAILGALRTGLIHVLVTDDATARRILELADAYPERGPAIDDANDAPTGDATQPTGPRLRETRAILDAAILLVERDGYRELTIEAVAAKAGVSRQTIFRSWPSTAALAIEAYSAATEERLKGVETGDVRAELEAILGAIFGENAAHYRGPPLMNRTMMAEAQLDREFHHAYGGLHQAWRDCLSTALERGKARGELNHDADSELLVDVLLGAPWRRVLLNHAQFDSAFIRRIIEMMISTNRPAGFVSTKRPRDISSREQAAS